MWGYCLMPNHMHRILTPKTPEGPAGRSARPTALFRLRQRAQPRDLPSL